jgi:ABC-type phosphate transport system substrate-binding protein
MSLHLRRAVLATASLTTAFAMLSAGHASAALQTDPPMTPAKKDIVGVGSDTTQDVIGRSGSTLAKSGFVDNYNDTDPKNKLWSFDAFPAGDQIVTKQGCEPITRPSGSSAGIAALKADQAAGTGCIDFARSSRPKNPSTDGNLVFIPFARDGVSWAAFPSSEGGRDFNAPANLTTAQLTSIFNCSVTNWSQVGGADAPIEPYLPQSGSGTRSFWLSAINVATPGACVNQPAGFPENDGSAVPAADRANAILPYSIATWLAQNKGTSDDVRAGAEVRNVDGEKPVAKNKLNKGFAPGFLRDVFNVLKPEDQRAKAFKKVFGKKGYICKHPKITEAFGFGSLRGSDCGY